MKTIALLLATITTGLMSGVYASYAFSVMPGLRGADDRTFVDVMQRFNVAILNGWFLLCFLGGLVFGGWRWCCAGGPRPGRGSRSGWGSTGSRC
jgi:uncharacterized membrane protein